MAIYTGHGLATPSSSETPKGYELTMAVYTGHALATPSSRATAKGYDLTMAVYTGHSLTTPFPPSNETGYALTMDVYTGHSLARTSHSSNLTSSASDTKSYKLTMDVYTASGHKNHTQVTGKRNPAKSSTFTTFTIYNTTTTKEVGGPTDVDSESAPEETTTNPPPSKETADSSSASKRSSCYPKRGTSDEDKLIENSHVSVEKWCGDPTQVYENFQSQPLARYIKVGWTLDDNAPKQCHDLPTTKGDSDAFWACKIALETIARDCPWNGGTIENACGQFRLRGCTGPCVDEA
jgi:hypothetical protein